MFRMGRTKEDQKNDRQAFEKGLQESKKKVVKFKD